MSTITFPKAFEPTALTTSSASLYDVASSPTSLRLKGAVLRFTNITAAPVTVTCYAVPASGTAGDTNAVVKEKSVAANDYLDVEIPVLKAGDSIEALASAGTSITAHFLAGHLIQ